MQPPIGAVDRRYRTVIRIIVRDGNFAWPSGLTQPVTSLNTLVRIVQGETGRNGSDEFNQPLWRMV